MNAPTTKTRIPIGSVWVRMEDNNQAVVTHSSIRHVRGEVYGVPATGGLFSHLGQFDRPREDFLSEFYTVIGE